jgi:transcription antitermination factor NusG
MLSAHEEDNNREKTPISSPQPIVPLSPRWYALYLRSRYEKRAHQLLLGKGVESFLPRIEEVHTWSDRKKVVEEPLFRGYLFVRTDLKDRISILETDGVVHFVRIGAKLSAIPDEQINWVRILVGHPDRVVREEYMSEGQRVRVKAGPMMGVQGYVLKVKSSTRVVVSLDAIARSVSIDIDPELLELL